MDKTLRQIGEEYRELALAELLDDVDCSLSTVQRRSRQLLDLSKAAGDSLTGRWNRQVEKKARGMRMCSGAPYTG